MATYMSGCTLCFVIIYLHPIRPSTTRKQVLSSSYTNKISAMSATMLDLPERCLRRVFAYLPLRDLLRLDQCHPGWVTAQRAVCLTRTTLTVMVNEHPNNSRYVVTYYGYLWSMDDVIPHFTELEPTLEHESSEWQSSLPLLSHFDMLEFDWLYSRDSDWLVSMLPNVCHLNILAFQDCYRYVGERSSSHRLGLMRSVFELVNKWSSQLIKLSLSLNPFYHSGRAKSDQFRADWKLMVQTLNSLPALRQLSLSFDKILFESAPNVVEEDKEKLAELRMELTFLSKLTHLYLNVDKAGMMQVEENKAWNLIHDHFTDSLLRHSKTNSLQSLILNDMRDDDLHRAVFREFAPTITLLPQMFFSSTLHIDSLARMVNLRSVSIALLYDEVSDKLTKSIHRLLRRTLTPLRQLIHLHLRLDWNGAEDGESSDITDGLKGDVESLPDQTSSNNSLDTVRMLRLFTNFDRPKWVAFLGLVMTSCNWSQLLPSLQIVTVDNNNWENPKELPVVLPPLANRTAAGLVEHQQQYCACELWALQVFGPCPGLKALYTTHDHENVIDN